MIRVKPIEILDPPQGGGTVTSVVAQKKDPNRCSIDIDDAYAFGLHVDIVIEVGLKKGTQLSEEQCQELVERDLYFKAMKRCMDYLAFRPRSSMEIKTRLKDLAVPAPVGDRICDRLIELGYVDDRAFARQWAESRSRSKGYGPYRLKQELIRKGIPSEMAARAVDEACSSELISQQLHNQLTGALRRYRNETDEQAKKRKILQFLIRRGFSTGDILDALKSVSNP